MKKMIFLFLIFISPFVVRAEMDLKKIQTEISKVARTSAFVDKVLDSYGLVGMPRQVLREHLQELYASNDVIDLVVREMFNAGVAQWNKDNAFEYGKKFGAELFMSYAVRGLSRLSLDDQRAFIRFLHKWMQYASSDDCKKLMVAGSNSSALEDANIEMKYYHLMSREDLRMYFSIIRKSLMSEIRDFPAKRSINHQQAKIADDAFSVELEKRIRNGVIDTRTLDAMANLQNATARIACEASMHTLSIVLDVRGFTGDLLITRTILSMQ